MTRKNTTNMINRVKTESVVKTIDFSKFAVYMVATLWLVIIIALCFGKVVNSKERIAGQEMNAYFVQMEKETVKEVRAVLGSEGYFNSGVTLTRVTYTEDNVEYELTIHHAGLYEMDREDKQILIEKLDDISAKRGYTFLINFYQA